ncbi:signaling protein, partial [Burkholderia multivorans]
YYPLETTREQVAESNSYEMTSSQDVAVAAAMEQLDKPYTVSLLVDEVTQGAPADGRLESGDRILSVNGTGLETDPEAAAKMSTTVQNSDSVDLVVDRDGEQVELTLEPATIQGRNA